MKEIEDIRAGIRVQEIQDKETSGTPPHQIEVCPRVFEDLESSMSHARQTGGAEQAAEDIFSSSDPITAAEPADSTLEAKVHLPFHYQHFHRK